MTNGLHHCKPGRSKNNDGPVFPSSGYGAAIEECEETEQGELWAGNSEYGTQVNFCPFCGYKARRQVALSSMGPFRVIVSEDIPQGQIKFVAPGGDVVGKVINLGK